MSILDAMASDRRAWEGVRKWAAGLAVCASLVVSACSPPYGDLKVGDCVKGNPQYEDAYSRIDCSEAVNEDRAFRLADKGAKSDPDFFCGPFTMGITDGEWVVCFEAVP